ncbi:unnamed protein product [Effrenium voratum]|nr:unnamed protein product [Effrenium voratum]
MLVAVRNTTQPVEWDTSYFIWSPPVAQIWLGKHWIRRAMSVAAPAQLWVSVLPGLQHCGGRFVLQKETANDKPLWKKADDEVWIYANKSGHWCFGGPDAKLHNFDYNRCYLYLKDAELPSSLCLWQAWNGARGCWAQTSLCVSEAPQTPPGQCQALAAGEVAQLRAWAESQRRKRDWWLPPAPPELPEQPQTEQMEQMEQMEQRATSLAQLGIDLASPLFEERGQTLLMLGAEQGWLQLCRHLCTATSASRLAAYLNAQEDESGYTALFYAVRAGHAEVARLLLDAKASPNVETSRSRTTPLLLALQRREASLVQLLMACRADVPGKPEDLADTEEMRLLLTAPARNIRRRLVIYTSEDQIGIQWFETKGVMLVRSLRPEEKASQAGVRPGWVLLTVDGAAPKSAPVPPVELEFQRPLQLPDDFWQRHLAEMIDANRCTSMRIDANACLVHCGILSGLHCRPLARLDVFLSRQAAVYLSH